MQASINANRGVLARRHARVTFITDMVPRSPAEALTNTETELKKEQAAGLGHTARLFERALAQYRENQHDAAAAAEAKKRLWYLVIQREAVGIRRHRDLYELYEVPGPWRF